MPAGDHVYNLLQMLAAECRLDAVVGINVLTELIGSSYQHWFTTTLHQLTPDQRRLCRTPTICTTRLLQPVLHCSTKSFFVCICHYYMTGCAIASSLKFIGKSNVYTYRNELVKLITKKTVLVQTGCFYCLCSICNRRNAQGRFKKNIWEGVGARQKNLTTFFSHRPQNTGQKLPNQPLQPSKNAKTPPYTDFTTAYRYCCCNQRLEGGKAKVWGGIVPLPRPNVKPRLTMLHSCNTSHNVFYVVETTALLGIHMTKTMCI